VSHWRRVMSRKLTGLAKPAPGIARYYLLRGTPREETNPFQPRRRFTALFPA